MRHSMPCAFAVLASILPAATTLAAVVPFTETFNSGPANWRDGAGLVALTTTPAAGPDGSAAVVTPFSFTGTVAGSTPILAQGRSSFGTSGGAFFGSYAADGVTALEFDVLHDAASPLTFFARFATAGNFPAFAVLSQPVAPGQWTRVSLDVRRAGNPALVVEAPPGQEAAFYASAFGAVARVQLGIFVGGPLAGTDAQVQVRFDNVAIVPAPAAGAAFGLLGLAALRRRRRA